MKLIYLADTVKKTIKRILDDKGLQVCNLDETKVKISLESFQGDEIATSVFLKKYALRDENENILELTLDEAKERWAEELSKAEMLFSGPGTRIYPKDYFKVLYNYFLPAGRQMFALGNTYVPKATLTNCVSGDTLVFTDDGIFPIKDLVNKKTNVRIDGKSYPAKVWKTGEKKTTTIVTKEGFQLTATDDHRLRMEDGSWKEVRDLNVGDKLAFFMDKRDFKEDEDYKYAYTLGYDTGTDIIAYGKSFNVKHLKFSYYIKGLLTALFSHGNINKDSIVLNIDKKNFQNIQIALLFFGIKSFINDSSVTISGKSIVRFFDVIGNVSSGTGAMPNSEPLKNEDYITLAKKISNKKEEVYDLSIDSAPHAFSANGFVAHNCYVTEIGDSMEEIFDGAYKIAKTFSYGGGQGLDIGKLRPQSAKVSNSARFSTGAVSFMDLYSFVTGLIGQHGRRGALGITIPVNHPDIELFIDIKNNDTERVKFANISIKITDEFMEAVLGDKDFTLFFETKHEKIERTVKAKDLWMKIVSAAHKSAEPGVLFWDKAVEMSPSDTYDELKVSSTNPCGEQIMEKGSACVLGSLVLPNFISHPYTEGANFDFELFKIMVKRAVRHLDNVVELNLEKHAIEEQKISAKNGRRIGLGFTGLADCFIALNIKYDSEEAIEFVNKLSEAKRDVEYKASIILAKERGSFGLFNSKKHYERGFAATLPEDIKELGRKYGQRNVAISTLAPSGSLSIMAQCSSGIEPIFAFSYKRYTELGAKRKAFTIFHQGVAKYLEIKGIKNRKNLILPEVWVTSHDTDYQFRIMLQGALQKFIDSSISSTINLPSDVGVETVSQIYIKAWKEGLKGVTVYREGSREGILVTDDFAAAAGDPNMDTIVYRVKAEGGDKFYIPVSYEDGNVSKPYQVFVMNYKTAENDRFSQLARELKAMLIKNNVDQERVKKYSKRSSNTLTRLTRFLSLSFKTGNIEGALEILDNHAFAGTLASELFKIFNNSLSVTKSLCKECGGSNVRMEEGCMHCLDCGWSACG